MLERTVSQLRLELQLVLAFEQICPFPELEAVWRWNVSEYKE